MKEQQYNLAFDFDNPQNDCPSPALVRNEAKEDDLSNRIPDYELFCRIKLFNLFQAEWVEEWALNVLLRNEQEYLIDLLRLRDTAMPNLKGIGEKRAARLSLWKQEIISDPQPYIDFYKEYFLINILPEHQAKGELGSRNILLLFVRQYMAYLKRIHSEDLSLVLSLYLGVDGTRYGFKQIAAQVSVTPERVRQKLVEIANDWMSLYQGKTIGNIQASDELKNMIHVLFSYLYRPISLYQMQFYLLTERTSDEDIVQGFTDFLGLFGMDLLVETYFGQQNTYIIIDKDKKGLYRKAVSFLISIMRTSLFWFHVDTIKSEYAKWEHAKEVDLSIIDSILEHNPCFERTNDEHYRLKWPFFNNMLMEIRRILVDARKPLFRDEILDAYNLYSRIYGRNGLTDRQLVITSDVNFVSQKKSGLWQYAPNGLEKEDVRSFMASYLLSHEGKILFNELIPVVREAGYQYPDETIRAYLSVFCRVALNDKNLFIHKECISLYPEILLRKMNVKLKKRLSPPYYAQVIQRTVDYLRQQPSRQSSLITIMKECEELIPAEINKNILYKIVRSSEQLEVYQDEASGKKWIRLVSS